MRQAGALVLVGLGATCCSTQHPSSPAPQIAFMVVQHGSQASLEITRTSNHSTRVSDVALSTNYISLLESLPIGNHSNREGGPTDIAVTFYERISPSTTCAFPLQYPVLAVVSSESEQVIARTTPPLQKLCGSVPTFNNPDHSIPTILSYSDYPKDPIGRLHPFLAPSFGDGDPVYTSGRWGYLCLFSMGSESSDCGHNFQKIDTLADQFREVGGFLLDLDHDGWDEIVLIYHYSLQFVSVRTGTTIDRVTYNVAYPTHPNEHINYAAGVEPVLERTKDLHSGRNYGVFSAFRGVDLKSRVAVVSGSPVGAFADYLCNVSRYVAVLEEDRKSLRLSWSTFYGFHSTTFSKLDPALAKEPPVDRLGDFVNGCIHRFSDSRVVMETRDPATRKASRADVAVIDVFHATDTVDRCLHEQYALYIPPVTTWGDDKYRSWLACAEHSRATKGGWHVVTIDLADGTVLSDTNGMYLWGWTDHILPGGQMVYLVELLPDEVAFDLAQATRPVTISLATQVAGKWSVIATMPSGSGRPKIRRDRKAHGSTGTGASTFLAELALQDRDGDGYVEVQMADGSWVGYDRNTHGVIIKR